MQIFGETRAAGAGGAAVAGARVSQAERVWGGLLFGGAVVMFSALVLPTLGEGIGNWDGHKILLTSQALLDRHEVVLSRAPGHPATDFFLFGGLGWILRQGFGRAFDATVFLTVQWLVALAVAGVFGVWLRRTGIPPLRAALAVACLLFSPSFLEQTLDGVEILEGLLCLLGGLVLLSRDAPGRAGWGRLAGAAALFAVAAGCRSELALAGPVIFPAYLLRRGVREARVWLGCAAMVAVACALVWLPVLPVILRDGSRAGEVADVRGPLVLIWGYKVLFRCFGFPASLVLLAVWAVAAAGWRWSAVAENKNNGYAETVCLALCGVYLALFLVLPGKPAYMLVCLPFLLWLGARRHLAWPGAVAVLTLVGLRVGVDIFRGRTLVAPHFTAGAYAQALAGKPLRQGAYIAALAQVATAEKAVVIGDQWSWVYAYHAQRGTLPAVPVNLGRGQGEGYAIGGDLRRIILPREAAWFPQQLARFEREGFEIVMDRTLWRTLFSRYEVTAVTPDRVNIGAVPVRLVDVVPPPEGARKRGGG